MLVHLGRDGVAAKRPELVNQRSIWVRADQVTVAPISATVTVDWTAYTATIQRPDKPPQVLQIGNRSFSHSALVRSISWSAFSKENLTVAALVSPERSEVMVVMVQVAIAVDAK